MHYRTRSSAKFRVTLRQTRETSVQSGSGTRIKKSAYKGLLNNRPFTLVDHVTSNKELMNEFFGKSGTIELAGGHKPEINDLSR